MARSKLIHSVESNSQRVHEDAPTSNFRLRVMEARQRRIESHGTSFTGRPELDIMDNPFRAMMQANRGVLQMAVYRTFTRTERVLRWLIWKLDAWAEAISDREWAKIERL